jgi:antitoxin PrlF
MESSITTKGQITIPKEARTQMNLSPGDRVKFFFDGRGNLVILPKLPITALKGMIPLRKRKAISLEQMDRDMIEAATERHSKKRR